MRKTKRSLALVAAASLAGVMITACAVTDQGAASSASQNTSSASADVSAAAEKPMEDEVVKNADILIRFSHCDSEGSLLNDKYYTYSTTFKRIVEDRTGGRIAVEIFPNNQLGDLPSALEQTSQGLIEMAGGQNTGLLAGYTNDIQCLDIPYSFPSVEVALDVLNGEFGDKLNQMVIDGGNVRVLSWLPTSFRNFISKGKQIKQASDLKGMKIRVMEVPIHVTMIEKLGGVPSVVSFSELYSAMQTGVVDGHEQAPYTVLMNNLQEVADYYTLDQHIINANAVTMNEKFYQSLSEEDQKTILYAARQAQSAMMGIVTATESQDLEKIKAAGVEIYTPSEEEIATFKDATQQPIIDMLIKDGVDSAIIDEMYAAIKASSEKFNGKQY